MLRLPPQGACAGSENQGHRTHPSEGLWGLPLETREEVGCALNRVGLLAWLLPVWWLVLRE